MTTTPTPGPWLEELHAHMNKAGDWVCEVRTKLGGLIARLCGSDRAEVEANARLIAAAPELRALLETLAAVGDNDGPLAAAYRKECEDARVLLARIAP